MEFDYSTRNPQVPVAYAFFGGMHTVMEIVITSVCAHTARETCERADKLVGEIEGGLSRHLPGSYLSVLNSVGEATVDEDTYLVLELCETMRGATEGYFDIAALSPGRVRPAYVTDPASRKVETAAPGIVLDLGGFAKGYALDRVKAIFKDAGAGSALVNFGNSSVLGVGSHPLGEGWPVDVATGGGGFLLNDSALSVSGLTPSGDAHIVDPSTGKRVRRDELIVVTGRSALVCEVLSTALYAAPWERRRPIIEKFDGYTAVSVSPDGRRKPV